MLAPSLIQRSEDWVGIAIPMVLPSPVVASAVVSPSVVVSAVSVVVSAVFVSAVSEELLVVLAQAARAKIMAHARRMARIFFRHHRTIVSAAFAQSFAPSVQL